MKDDLYQIPLFHAEEMKDLVAPPPAGPDLFVVRAYSIKTDAWVLQYPPKKSLKEAIEFAEGLSSTWIYQQVYRLAGQPSPHNNKIVHMATFAERLKLFRTKYGLSLKDLSEKTGIPQRSMYRYAKGDGFPDAPSGAKLANALHVSVDELFGE